MRVFILSVTIITERNAACNNLVNRVIIVYQKILSVIIMTEKLYYQDSHIKDFAAVVTGCHPAGDKWEISLDRTAFFPEGGGQAGDTGTIGAVSVLDTQEHDGEIWHLTDNAIEVGTAVEGRLDWDRRFLNMQGHSGEHILSGVVYELFGYHNVGFHMGADGIIIDFDGYITPEQLSDIELRVNAIICENRPITTYFPTPDELRDLQYRSKLELTENVRIVTVDGADACACCAPHVKQTGEVGLFKIMESIRRKDGVRLRMLAGKAALMDYREKSQSAAKISAMLSAKQNEIALAVSRLMEEKEKLSYDLGTLARLAVSLIADSTAPTDGNIVIFQPLFSADELRQLANALLPKCGGICALFSGSDEDGYKYVMASKSVDLRQESKAINAALIGRGGGTPQMIQGSVTATKERITEYFTSEQ